uniref:alpha-glucosidase n=1 Tax=Triatoma infestans TaxID=30076 RepID=A0A023EYE6_TRIIF
MDNNGKLNREDEAEEKLVEDGEANMKVEIQLVGNEPQNGETKISMSEIKAAFIGMGKEELMKYANDPFWVKLRWFLFVLFWLLWFGMLFGAIAIILLAPKCSSPEPRNWYENSPIYHLTVSDFKDGASPQDGVGDLEGLLEKASYLKELGIETLMIDPLMPSTMGNPERIEDFKQVDPRYGTVDNVKKVLSALKQEGFHVIMRIVPNYSSNNHTWFQKSIEKIPPYSDYYVWSNGKADEPPSNWLSVNGGSAWTWNEHRKQYYLHQFAETQPDLNFRNPEVIEYFSEVLKWWLDLGLSGIHVDKVDFLFESLNYTDETISNNPGTVHDEYDFYRHTNTRDLPELVGVIKQWAAVVKNSSGVFSLNGVPDSEEFDSANLIHRPLVIKNDDLTAEHLERYVNHKLKMNQQTWTVETIGNVRPPSDSAECLIDMMLLLPGTLVVPSGSELGLEPGSIIPWDLSNSNAGFTTANTTWKKLPSNYLEANVENEKTQADSYYHTFKSLVKERSSPSIIHGTTETAVINSTVFAFTRLKSGNPGYLVAFNLEPKEKVVNLSNMKHVPDELTVIARSKQLWKQLPLKTSILSNSLKMAPASCVVLQFVPLNTEA